MTLLNNPFVTSGYIAPEYFCDRERETEELLRWLVNENNVAIISTRRMGKTGLIQHCFHLKEIKENCIKTLSYTTLKKIVSVEDTMNAVIENYNAENYIEMETSLSIFKNKIEELKNELKIENTKEYINESNVAENIMKSYINCKKGEYYYYRGMLFLNAKNNILEGE